MEIRCFCRARSLLAVAGCDSSGKTVVHIKVHKQKQLYAEIVVLTGVIKLRCRECRRWHVLRIVRDGHVDSEPLPDYSEIEISAPPPNGLVRENDGA